MEIPNFTADWKLNLNVECRIVLNKLKIKTPEYGTMEFCRTLTTTTKDMDFDFKSEFVFDVLLNDILRKCDEKCGLCEEYVHELRHHITQAHTTRPNSQIVFKCDICNSIFSSPLMVIRHRDTHTYNSDTLTNPCTNEPEPVRFDSSNISTSFDISSVSRTNDSVSSGQCKDHPHQPVPVPPMNVECNSVKQEEFSSSQSKLEISHPNQLGILQHMNHLSAIENNLKQEWNDFECEEDLRDPLLLHDSQVPVVIKYECIGTSTESEEQTVLMTHEKSSNDTPAGRESFPVPSDLIRHEMTHTGVEPHECVVCGKCFSERYNLNKHKLLHTGVKGHKCDVCGKCFGHHSYLVQHKSIHTGERPYGCDVCEKSFRQNAHLARHKLTHTGEKPFHSDVCGKYFLQRSKLTVHKLTHTGEVEEPHTCDVCGRSFNQHLQLTKHKLVHTGEKRHKCDVCGKGFDSRACVQRHKLIHTGEKPFQCDVCGRDFALKSNLTRHKLIHTGDKPHKCDVCGKCFSIRTNLRKHKLIHAAERSHKCDVCGMSFSRRYALVQHKLTHTGEISFHCDVCGQKFEERYELTNHKLKHDVESTSTTFVHHLKEEHEAEEEGCQEDPLLNL